MSKKPSHNLIWDRSAECMSLSERKELQLNRLRDLIERVYVQSPFYRKLYTEHQIKPQNIRSLEDLQQLPFTVKSDLRDNYPFELFCTPLKEVVRLHCSSGTTGKPVVSAFTKNDLDMWSEMMARSFTSAGTTNRDVVHVSYGYGLFTGGLGADMGSLRVGASTVPVSGGLNNRQIMLLEDFGATVLACTPSYALVIAEAAAQLGVDIPSRFRLRTGIFGAEPWTEEMRAEIEEKLNLEAYDIFGMGEIMGPGVAVECPYHNGMHIQDDYFLPEIIDPDTGELLGPGEQGELVLTTLTKEAMPLIRYRTRDITRLEYEPCPCGRTSVRFHKLAGRTDDMLIIRGVNVFPSQIEGVLLRFEELEPQYLLMVERVNNLDRLEVLVEAKDEFYNLGEEAIEAFSNKVKHELHQMLYISTKVTIVPPRTIQRSEGKAKRIIDKRKESI
ncbi:phenylacetate--CoA ligase family protein [Desulfoscipio gibsoniae]|uniref:Phenylacetate-coenzyme A ligase n=1 Tax=Desulfoscipio gibsoniae DSM 7213 TaxID=767817 RepID=R4KE98_9FIRM|nr:phenylacetate--CoA ligase [Desulfoscipio gibsoniae]AGL00914.1 coenzyme F390 synthetase [Desulfoscipio gibsoniae DSM 7213]